MKNQHPGKGCWSVSKNPKMYKTDAPKASL